MVMVSSEFEPEFLALSRRLELDAYITGYPDPATIDRVFQDLSQGKKYFHAADDTRESENRTDKSEE